MSDGTPATIPVPLNGGGEVLVFKAGDEFRGVYLDFDVYDEADFSVLNLEGAG